jgi:uncharacterized protein DUF5372
VETTGRKVRITHPFHPLSGHEIELICRRLHWGEDRVAYHDEAGRLRWISADLTDVDPPEDFQRVAAGTAAFLPVDLLALCTLLERLRERLEHDDA